jgi:DNA repair exonuclease SbcCD nuclease subunit
MRIVITSDWHVDHVSHGIPRYHEIGKAVHDVVTFAIEREADAFLFLGDLCDPDSGSSVFRCVGLALQAAQKLAKHGIDSHWIAGNHDVIEDGTGDTTLAPLKGCADGVVVYERPGSSVIMPRQSGDAFQLIALPFTATGFGYDPAEEVRRMRSTTPAQTIVAAHLAVPGVEPGEETTELPRGREVVLPVADIRPHARTILNGHYHRQQRSPDGVWIPGSLARLTFCEERNHPGFLMLEI